MQISNLSAKRKIPSLLCADGIFKVKIPRFSKEFLAEVREIDIFPFKKKEKTMRLPLATLPFFFLFLD